MVFLLPLTASSLCLLKLIPPHQPWHVEGPQGSILTISFFHWLPSSSTVSSPVINLIYTWYEFLYFQTRLLLWALELSCPMRKSRIIYSYWAFEMWLAQLRNYNFHFNSFKCKWTVVVDSVDTEYLHHHRTFYWTVLHIHTQSYPAAC